MTIILFMKENISYGAEIAAAALILHYLWSVFSDPLRTVPGVLCARFTRLWEWHENMGGAFERTNIKLHDKYGDVVRLSPNRYSIRGADNLKKIYGPGTKFLKTPFYSAFGTPEPHRDLFSEQNNSKHAAQRRLMSVMYSMSSLVSYEAVVEQASTDFCRHLDQLASEGARFDLFSWMQYYAFDVIGEVTVGHPFGMMEQRKDVGGILGEVHASVSYGSRVGIFPELHRILGPIKDLLFANPNKGILGYVARAIQECENMPKQDDRESFVHKCLKLRKEGKLDDPAFINVIAQNVGAGSDTTGIALSAIVFNLTENPAALSQLRKELTDARNDGRISDPISFKEAQSLPYLQAVIKEGLRIHPAVGQILPRIVPEGGAQLAGRFFPAGVSGIGNVTGVLHVLISLQTEVGANAWVVHYDTGVWGPDAALFRPERWFDSAADIAKLEQNYMPVSVAPLT